MTDLGLGESQKKAESPTTRITFLGVQFDSTAMTMSVPPRSQTSRIENRDQIVDKENKYWSITIACIERLNGDGWPQLDGFYPFNS